MEILEGYDNWIDGFDVSHWNGINFIPSVLDKYGKKMKFVVIKCTEGKTYVDPVAMYHATDADDYNLTYGLYHYARAENNAPEEEALHFCENAKAIAVAVKRAPFLVLDWEGSSLQKGQDWAYQFAKKVIELTGCKPIIYCSASVVKQVSALKQLDCGIWIANRTLKLPDPAPWDVVTMWQYRADPFDFDKFNGSEEQLMKYCAPTNWYMQYSDKCLGSCGCCCYDRG